MLPDERRVNVPVVYVSMRDSGADKKAFLSRLHETMKNELPEYDQPKQIVILEKMPMTQSGKIDYQTLEKQAGKE